MPSISSTSQAQTPAIQVAVAIGLPVASGTIALMVARLGALDWKGQAVSLTTGTTIGYFLTPKGVAPLPIVIERPVVRLSEPVRKGASD